MEKKTVNHSGETYELKPTSKSRTTGEQIGYDGEVAQEKRNVKQYGLYNEHGEKIFTCGQGEVNGAVDIYDRGKKVGSGRVKTS